MQSFSLFICDHLLTNTIMMFTLTETSLLTTPFALSVSEVFVALFCYRRWALRAARSKQLLEDGLRVVSLRCAELVRMVLESGDELCSANAGVLEDVIEMLSFGEAAGAACSWPALAAQRPAAARPWRRHSPIDPHHAAVWTAEQSAPSVWPLSADPA
eukprot:TRINITY_DN10546_c0_g1_i2.p2 TRINITY_DN10546_c0_g1~~TRINITY_DN10546_c0_g1_i2.p2  ORF type:complete len:158 (-),score=19.57 TRINITY_DN10546_c0_g1_i2:277-750(-)